MLLDTDVPGYAIPWGLIALVTAASAAFVLLVVGMALKARQRPVVSGAEELVGALGEMIEHKDGDWWARVQSESWKVRSRERLHRGQQVRVVGMDGLVLLVEPLDRAQQGE
jgi:membrane-bound serine protease (ClpP class)